MVYRTECSHCQDEIKLKDARLIGQLIRCPTCWELFVVRSDMEAAQDSSWSPLEYEPECPECNVCLTAKERGRGRCVACGALLPVKDSERFIVKPGEERSLRGSRYGNRNRVQSKASFEPREKSVWLPYVMLVLFLVGVAVIWTQGRLDSDPVTRDQFDQIETGMTESKVVEILGPMKTSIGDEFEEHAAYWCEHAKAGEPGISVDFDGAGRVIDKSFKPLTEEEAGYLAESEAQAKKNLLVNRVTATVSLGLALLVMASLGRVFEKAGEGWWGVLIPIYNVMVLLRICERPLWWALPIILFYIGPLLPFLMFLAGAFEVFFGSKLFGAFLLAIAAFLGVAILGGFVMWILAMVSLSERFGGKGGLVIGLILLPVVFFPILGFGNSTYQPD